MSVWVSWTVEADSEEEAFDKALEQKPSMDPQEKEEISGGLTKLTLISPATMSVLEFDDGFIDVQEAI